MNNWFRRHTAHIPVSAWSAQSQNALNACEYPRALQLARKAVNYADRWLPPYHFATVAARRALADAYLALGRLAEAQSTLAPALEGVDDITRQNPEIAIALLHDQSLLLEKIGDHIAAQQAIQRALTLAETVGDANNQLLASALARQGDAEVMAAHYTAAERSYRRALGLLAQTDSEVQAERMRIRLNLADLLRTMGRYVEAAAELNAIVEFASTSLRRSRTSPTYRGVTLEMTRVLNASGQLFESLGDLDQAESHYTSSYQASRALLGDNHLDIAVDLHNLARIAATRGDFRRARSMLQQAYDIRLRLLGDRHELVAATLSSLGALFYQMADYAQAERFLNAALASQSAIFGDNHADVASTLENLSVLYETAGAHSQAEVYGEQALVTMRALHGDNHPDVATALNNLALARESLGKYDDAQQLFEQALVIRRSFYADIHPYVAQSLNNLAALLSARGDYERASELYSEALSLKRRLLPPTHTSLATGLANLAAAQAARSHTDDALALLREAQSIQDVTLSLIFSLASERQRLAYLAHARGEFHLTLSLLLSQVPARPELATEAFNLVLRRKGISAETLLAQREAVASARNPAFASQWAELTSLRARIAAALLPHAGPAPSLVPPERIATWIAEREEREAALASNIPEINLTHRLATIDHERVTGALPDRTALIEYVKFRPYDFAAVPERGQPRWGAARYMAFVVHKRRPGLITAIDLGQAAPIETALEAHRSALTGVATVPTGSSAATDPHAPDTGDASDADSPDTTLRSALGAVTRYLRPAAPTLPSSDSVADTGRAVRSMIFDPLLTALGDTRRLFIAPDGALTILPFDVLPLEDSYPLIDAYDLSYLDVGRDIVRINASPLPSSHAPVVLADPDFDLDAQRSARSERDPGATGFPPLPGARIEGEAIARRLGVSPLLGDRALKSALTDAPAPRILHIATHGFLLTEIQPVNRLLPAENFPSFITHKDPTDDPSALQLSLARSGLALSGANAWLGQRPPFPGAGNGLLTAEDVATMDLDGTELVVLSACETGLGLAPAGEGVFGLRRAFTTAGARTLVMSLWRVPDAQTRQLMDDFYRHLLAGTPRAQALHEAQRALRAQYPPAYYWGAFVCLGDPRPLIGVTPAQPQERLTH